MRPAVDETSGGCSPGCWRGWSGSVVGIGRRPNAEVTGEAPYPPPPPGALLLYPPLFGGGLLSTTMANEEWRGSVAMVGKTAMAMEEEEGVCGLRL